MTDSKPLDIAVLPGDGIGEEVTHAAMPIFQELGLPITFSYGDIGWACWERAGNAFPDQSLELVTRSDATLLGAITSKPQREAIKALPKAMQANPPTYLSPLLKLRQQFDMYANVRPCYAIQSDSKHFNFCIIRENTEGLYSGLDYAPLPQSFNPILNDVPRWKDMPLDELAGSIRLQSSSGLTRIFKYAFQYAEANGFARVTFADKPNVLRHSSAFARDLFESVAKDYPNIEADIHNVDAVALWMVRRPEQFGVIVAENMFGDILSDVGAAVMGGLGLALSANIGDHACYFEPVHGSGPAIKKGQANPGAMFLTIALMLQHVGFSEQAFRVRQAVELVVSKAEVVTYDLGGKSSTQSMADAIIDAYIIGNGL
jgi:isocitrate/isopropylmalate dehydrogenase